MKITDVVFTNHAIERMRDRKISGDLAWQTVKKADKVNPGKEKHTTEFIKRINERNFTVIGKKNDIGEWVVLSVWVDPPFEGTLDYHKRQKYDKKMDKYRSFDRKMDKASFWGKILLTIRKQLGI